jgi:hypothetical protein
VEGLEKVCYLTTKNCEIMDPRRSSAFAGSAASFGQLSNLPSKALNLLGACTESRFRSDASLRWRMDAPDRVEVVIVYPRPGTDSP